MAYPEYIRERAVQMRVERDLTIDEIAERLALPRTTIFYWVKDIPLRRERDWRLSTLRAGEATRAKHQKLRDAAYAVGAKEYTDLMKVPTFGDFVVLYIAEGFKRRRNVVSICNSDDRVVALSYAWIQRFAARKLTCSLQFHADQNLDELRSYWGQVLKIDGAEIRMQRKSNSNQLAGRTWRSEHAVLTVCTNDTLFRARLQAWMDRMRAGWTLDCAGPHGV